MTALVLLALAAGIALGIVVAALAALVLVVYWFARFLESAE